MLLSDRLKNLAEAGQLNPHRPALAEIQQHLGKAERVLGDARRPENSLEGRFENANSAGHALLMAALKMKGYRPSSEKGHRAILYQLLDQLVPGAAGAKDTLARVHNLRNRSEYDGDDIDVTQGLVDDLIDAVTDVQEEVAVMFGSFKRAALQAQNPSAPKTTPRSSGKKPG